VTPAAALALAAALGFSPLKAEQEDVRHGNEKLVTGDGEAALRHYDDAERKAGAHPEIEYDRGNAAFRLGKLDEAAARYRRAAEQAPAPLASRALQNLGNTLDAKGDKPGAIGAFVEALRKDPQNEDARYDLEVLLRRKEPPRSPQPQQQGGKPSQGGKGDQQQDAPRQGGDSQPQQQQPSQGREGPQGPEQPRDPGGAAQQPEPSDRDEGARPGPLDRQDAEKLLDALRAREKNLPIAGRDRKGTGRTDAERDW
jgi:Ca-activated chloride channel family protein